VQVTGPETRGPGKAQAGSVGRFLAAGPLNEVGGEFGEGEAVALGCRGQQVEGMLRGAAALGDEDARRLLEDPAGVQGLL
jgi:hypothetical protein